jgi:hypothetical protein
VTAAGFRAPGSSSRIFGITDDMELVDMRNLTARRAAMDMSSITNLWP